MIDVSSLEVTRYWNNDGASITDSLDIYIGTDTDMSIKSVAVSKHR